MFSDILILDKLGFFATVSGLNMAFPVYGGTRCMIRQLFLAAMF